MALSVVEGFPQSSKPLAPQIHPISLFIEKAHSRRGRTPALCGWG